LQAVISIDNRIRDFQWAHPTKLSPARNSHLAAGHGKDRDDVSRRTPDVLATLPQSKSNRGR